MRMACEFYNEMRGKAIRNVCVEQDLQFSTEEQRLKVFEKIIHQWLPSHYFLQRLFILLFFFLKQNIISIHCNFSVRTISYAVHENRFMFPVLRENLFTQNRQRAFWNKRLKHREINIMQIYMQKMTTKCFYSAVVSILVQ